MALNPTLQLPDVPVDEEAAPPTQSIQDVKNSAAEMLKNSPVAPRSGAPGAPPRGDTDAWLKNMTASLPQPPKPRESVFGGVGKAIAGGAAELGHQITGAAAWAGNQVAPGSAVASGLNTANQIAGQSAEDWQQSQTPEDRDLMAREWTTLDPAKSIWQGSPHDFVHALTLQMGNAAPATLSMLLPMTAWAKAGMTAKALTYVGATQAGLSLGQISNNIQQEVASRDDNTLRQQSPAFAQMLDKGMDPAQARQQLVTQASRYAPVVGGLVAGAISAIGGRYLTPVMTGAAGAGILRRAALGFADQAAQGAGVGAANYVATETAANVYDKGRSPDLMGAAHAAGEAAASQGVLGAGLAAAHGRSQPLLSRDKTVAPDIHATMANTPENKATGAAPETHTTNISAGNEYEPIERNREGETLTGEQTSAEQRLEPEQQPLPFGPHEELQAAVRAHYDRGAGAEVPHWGQEEQQYRGAPPPEQQQPVPNGMQEPNGPQGNLDLTGGQMNPPRPGPTPPVPATAQLNLPLRRQARGGPEFPPVAEPPRTVADQLRARVASTPQDFNQPDLFRDQPQPGQLTTRGNRPTIQGNAEAPGARPFADVQGQLNELNDPQHPRAGVFLSGDTVASLRRSGLLERVRDGAGAEAVPLVNFDGKGGALIAKDQATADELTRYRDQKVGTPEEIIAHATGEQPGAPGPGEVLRRSRLTNVENEVQQRAVAEKETANAVRRSADQIPNETVSQRVRRAAARDLVSGQESPAVSREEAARRITAEAQRVHNETRGRAWAGIGAPDPRDVDFHSEDLQRQYQNLDHELAGMRVMHNTAADEAGRQHAQAGIDIAERRLAEFLRAHPHELRAEQVAKAGVRVSPEGVREFAENKRAKGRQYVRPLERVNVGEFKPREPVSRSELHKMHPEELESRYQEVLDRTSRTRAEEAAGERPTEHLTEGEEEGQQEPKAVTREEMIAADKGLRSLKEKRINRYYRTEAEYEARGFSNAKSDKMAVSPRRALTERETQLNAAKSKGQKKAVGYKTFDPRSLMATVESQREMEMSTKDRGERIKQRTVLKVGLEQSLKAGDKAVREMGKLEGSSMARRYMQQMMQYGRALRDHPMKGSEAMAAAKQFSAHVDMLAKMEPQKRAHYLEEAYKTELKRQNLRASGANPERMARVGELAEHYTAPEGSSSAGTRLDVGGTKPFSAERSTGHQLNLPFAERVQPKTGYTAEQARTEPLTAAEESELRGLINKEGPKQYKLALRGGQAEPQGTTIEVHSLSQYLKEDEPLRSALGYPQKPTAFRESAARIADMLERDRDHGVNGRFLISHVLDAFPEGSPMHRLFTALRNVVDEKTMVRYSDDMDENVRGTTKWGAAEPHIEINRQFLEQERALGFSPEFSLMHTLGHELAHVATSRAIHNNPMVRERLEAILAEVKKHPDAAAFYGAKTNNIHEMVAEAYSNRRFQEFLDKVRMPNVGRSLWKVFKSIVGDILGFKSTDEHFSALDAIMREHGTIFRGKEYATTPGQRRLSQNLEEDREGGHVGNALDRVTKSADFVKKLYSNATERAGQFGLSAMTPRQQSAQFSKYFDRPDGTNPYRRYWDTFFKRAADNALSMEHVGKLSNEWSNLEEKHGITQAATLSRIMHDATLYGFHPDLEPGDKANEHVTGENIARAAEVRKEFEALPAEMRAHYGKMRDYYAQEQRNTTDQIVVNALHAMLTKGEDAAMSPKDFDAKYDADAVRRLNLDTQEGLQKEFGDKLSGASQDMLAKIGKLSQQDGPYFPLNRNGDYVVTAKRQVANKEFDTSQAAQAYMREQRGNDPTLAVKVTHDVEEGVYRVSVTEREVRMAESKSEAAQHRQELAARYGEENTTPVQLKADLYKGEGSITTGSALDNIMRKLEGNPAAQNAIKDFYLRSLGEQSFRKHELSRKNVRGANIDNQHRSFAQYGRSQSYYLSQLKYGRHLANAQGEVHDAVMAHRDESQVSAVRMGEFARELSLRDEISRNPYQVADLVKKGSSLTQFYMLTSPSHWFVRAAQPYMLTAPWLGARHGMTESMDSLVRAQKMIASPLLNESVESGLGLKALFSRAAAEKTYSVIDQVMAHLTKQGADPKINEMIQHLRNNNLIDLSMATELSDISKGKSTGLAARVLDAGRTMLHIAEVNNRVMTAIAARELGLKQGMSEQQAWEHAADAINVTHNDYSYGNTPRLFMAQSKGLLGGARPLMFQFMKYPQQVYGMMISSGLAALKGKTAAERQVGLRTLSGVLLTHMLAAGAIGASIQPMKWALGGLMAGASALGMTDEPYTVASALSGDTYDHMLRSVANELFGTELGEVVSKGLPAAVGIDLSQRMALGSTYNFHLKTDSDASTLGSLMETFGGPWLNVAENFYDSGKSFLKGDVVKGIQQMTPHVIRDLVKAGAMSQQGVVNNAGTTVVPANQLSGPEIFAQSLGFRPEHVAEVQDRDNAERTALLNIQDQRKSLIQKYVAAEPSERNAVRQEAMTFNQKHPGFRLDYATFQRAVAAHQLAQQQIQQYGVRSRGRPPSEITAQGSMYNVK